MGGPPTVVPDMPPMSEVETKLLAHKAPNDFGHWAWGGASDTNGYGIIYLGDYLYRVADLSSWLWMNGPFPVPIPTSPSSKDSKDAKAPPGPITIPQPLSRTCGLPYCYNPQHLYYIVHTEEKDEEPEPELLQKSHHESKGKNKK